VSDDPPQAPYATAADEAAALAARMREYGVPPEAVAAIFLAVASDSAGRSSPDIDPARVRDWLFSLLSLDAIAASQARAIAEAAGPLERRAELRVIDGDK